MFGGSKELIESARSIMSGEMFAAAAPTADLASRIDVAKEVSSCSYEAGTSWGQEVFATVHLHGILQHASWFFPHHHVVAGRLGLRVDDGGQPDGAADPRRRLEVGAPEPRPAGVPRRRADRRAGQPHAVQEVGDGPAGDRLQPEQPGAPVDLQASRAPAVPRVPRHRRVAAQGAFRALLRPAGTLLPPCKPILPAKGNNILPSVYSVFFSDILLYLHWQSIILEHIALLLAFMITMFKMLVIASIMNKNISSSVLRFKM